MQMYHRAGHRWINPCAGIDRGLPPSPGHRTGRSPPWYFSDDVDSGVSGPADAHCRDGDAERSSCPSKW